MEKVYEFSVLSIFTDKHDLSQRLKEHEANEALMELLLLKLRKYISRPAASLGDTPRGTMLKMGAVKMRQK